MSDAPIFPCPVPPKPPMARGWCKHYSYALPKLARTTPVLQANEGPQCAIGCDLTAPGAATGCFPDPKTACTKRENWTDEEKATWDEWRNHSMARVFVCLQAIPEDGWQGHLPCPACGSGTISWSRARSNRHLHAGCSTPHCFGIIQ